jgi:hypothetical protein
MDLFKKNKVCLIVLVWIMGSLSLRAQTLQPADSTTGLSIRCEFSGLSVWVEDSLVGHTPLELISLRQGDYSVRVQHPDPSDWLSRDWEETVGLNPGQVKELVITFPDYVWVGSMPIGATVSRRDEILGMTPLLVRRLQTQGDKLIIKKDGYQDHVLYLGDISESRISIQLFANGPNRDISKPSPRLKKGWIIGLGAFGLVSGIAGYYFKDRAERAYGKYMKTGDPDKMDRHFDEVIKFDKLSGVFYGIGEVSISVSLVLSIRNVASK